MATTWWEAITQRKELILDVSALINWVVVVEGIK
jgi:hypothetical protein